MKINKPDTMDYIENTIQDEAQADAIDSMRGHEDTEESTKSLDNLTTFTVLGLIKPITYILMGIVFACTAVAILAKLYL